MAKIDAAFTIQIRDTEKADAPEAITVDRIKCSRDGKVRVRVTRGEVRRRMDLVIPNFVDLECGGRGSKVSRWAQQNHVQGRVHEMLSRLTPAEFEDRWAGGREINGDSDGEIDFDSLVPPAETEEVA